MHATRKKLPGTDVGITRLKNRAVYALDTGGHLGGWAKSAVGAIFLKPYTVSHKGKLVATLACGNVVINDKFQGSGIMRDILQWIPEESKRRGFHGVVFYTVNDAFSTVLSDALKRRGYQSYPYLLGTYVLIFDEGKSDAI